MKYIYETKDFKRGYDAAASCEDFDKNETKEWKRGYDKYGDDEAASENASWIW